MGLLVKKKKKIDNHITHLLETSFLVFCPALDKLNKALWHVGTWVMCLIMPASKVRLFLIISYRSKKLNKKCHRLYIVQSASLLSLPLLFSSPACSVNQTSDNMHAIQVDAVQHSLVQGQGKTRMIIVYTPYNVKCVSTSFVSSVPAAQ